jgi:ribosomal-protein-alanine N-acetyltransferase
LRRAPDWTLIDCHSSFTLLTQALLLTREAIASSHQEACPLSRSGLKSRPLGCGKTGPILFSMNNWRQSTINIREARPRDLDAIARLENGSFENDRVSRRSLREFLRAPHRPVIAATINDELAGYALVALRKRTRAVRIYSLAVDARFARRGVGRMLLQACEAYARRHRREALTLEVRYDNASAIALYESCGFRQFGEHAHYYADGATALRYEKSLLVAPQR